MSRVVSSPICESVLYLVNYGSVLHVQCVSTSRTLWDMHLELFLSFSLSFMVFVSKMRILEEFHAFSSHLSQLMNKNCKYRKKLDYGLLSILFFLRWGYLSDFLAFPPHLPLCTKNKNLHIIYGSTLPVYYIFMYVAPSYWSSWSCLLPCLFFATLLSPSLLLLPPRHPNYSSPLPPIE